MRATSNRRLAPPIGLDDRVEVLDVEAALAKAESLGGSRLMGPDEVPGGGPVIGQFADPEGHAIGLIQSA